jgi:tetratricopeptide (TPR) repeat protein
MKFDDGTDASLYSNRSIFWLRLGMGDEALSDACACIRMQPDLANGYYRKGMALCFLQVIIMALAILLFVDVN